MKIKTPSYAIPFIFFVLTALFFFSQQNELINHQTLGRVTKNWTVVDGQKTLQSIPFHSLNDSTVVRWDAKHYLLIKEHGYNVSQAGSDFIYAFFPAFPAFWRVTGLSAQWMPAVNFTLYVIGLLILYNLFGSRLRATGMWISMALPSIIIFLIPYTEALFFVLIAIGIFGYIKQKYLVYFMAMLLAALTRPSFTILGIALICNEFLNLAEHKNIRQFLFSSFKMVSPLLLGTFLVGLIQYSQGSGELFAFMRVQEYWGHKLGWPTKLTDWSHQGFDLNVAILFLLFIPISIYLLKLLMNNLRSVVTIGVPSFDRIVYLRNLSMIYILGTVLFVVFFRGGSLHCLFRFVMCSPFAYILLFTFPSFKLSNTRLNLGAGMFSLLALLTLTFVEYGRGWNFSDLGFFIFVSSLFLLINSDQNAKLWYRFQLTITVGLNVIWTAWMFNSYLGDCWIFA
jgi:hypothetical protein